MKLPDSHPLEPSSYVEIKEPWRTEWEIGVQVHIYYVSYCDNHLLQINTI